jgi:hypothetical protein
VKIKLMIQINVLITERDEFTYGWLIIGTGHFDGFVSAFFQTRQFVIILLIFRRQSKIQTKQRNRIDEMKIKNRNVATTNQNQRINRKLIWWIWMKTTTHLVCKEFLGHQWLVFPLNNRIKNVFSKMTPS